jgi:negative modulator of initiation of replication
MRVIEIEDDVYEYLLQNTTQIGESASQILRRLLSVPADRLKTNMTSENKDTELLECLNASDFKAKRNMIDKFLYILSYAHKQKGPEQFAKVLAISGWSRKYFALSSKELEDSGNSVHPKQIPDSLFWVITNNDNSQKRRMLQDVLKLLGYSDQAVKQAIGSLTY